MIDKFCDWYAFLFVENLCIAHIEVFGGEIRLLLGCLMLTLIFRLTALPDSLGTVQPTVCLPLVFDDVPRSSKNHYILMFKCQPILSNTKLKYVLTI